MRGTFRAGAILMGLAITAASCASPPTAEVDAATASVEKASAEGANKFAAASLKEAQNAQSALDTELKLQGEKWFKSYDRTRELAVAAKAAGDKASADAAA